MAGRGSIFITALLVASLVLVAFLVRLAYDAARSHRRVAEGVLADYASLAAHELVRRAANEVGYSGCYPIVTALRRLAGNLPGGAISAPEAAALGGDEGLRRALALSRTLFFFDPSRAEIAASGAPLDGEAAVWLTANLPALAAAKPDLDRSFASAPSRR